MPIEFPCTQCGKLLRTPDGSAGKQAKCPQCGAVLPIPHATAAPGGVPMPAPPPSAPPAMRPVEPSNPYQSPAGMGPALASGEVRRGFNPTRIDLGDVMSRTWSIFKANLWPCVGAVFIVFLLNSVVPNIILYLIQNADAPVKVAFHAVNITFSVWISIGLLTYMLKTARGERAEVTDLFSGGPLFLPALGIFILTYIAIVIGFVLCIIPGIIVMLMLSQALLVLIDQRTGVMDSLRYSMQATKGNKLTLVALYLIGAVLSILLTVITFGVGLLFVYPYMVLLYVVSYLAMTGQSTADQLNEPAAI